MGQKLVPGIVTRIPAPVSFNGDFNGDLMGFKWCFYGYLMWFNGIFMVIFNAMVVFNGDFMVIVWEYYGNIVGIQWDLPTTIGIYTRWSPTSEMFDQSTKPGEWSDIYPSMYLSKNLSLKEL